MPTTLHLCRHGETEANLAGRLQGQSESDLTAKGRAQAELLAEELRRRGPLAACYSSDLRRAYETAEAVVRAQLVPPRLKSDERLRERRLGALQGLPERESRSLYPDVWRAFLSETPCDPSAPGAAEQGGVELGAELRRRVGESLREIAAAHAGERVAVVSHGGTIHTALLTVSALRESEVRHIGNCSITTVEVVEGGSWRVIEVGESDHVTSVGNDAARQHGADWGVR